MTTHTVLKYVGVIASLLLGIHYSNICHAKASDHSEKLSSFSYDHGMVTMTGRLLNASCELMTSDDSQTISMGAVSLIKVQETGASDESDLIIHLRCPSYHGTSVGLSILFIGKVDSENPGLYAVENSKGIGIQIMSKSTKEIFHPGEKTLQHSQCDENGNLTLNYQIKIIKDGADYIPGLFNSTIKFFINYD